MNILLAIIIGILAYVILNFFLPSGLALVLAVLITVLMIARGDVGL